MRQFILTSFVVCVCGGLLYPFTTFGQNATCHVVQQSCKVYVCTGSGAYRYHSSSRCRGLNRCSADIVSTTSGTARSRGYTPCKIRY